MKLLRRSIALLLYFGLLAAVGAGAYLVVRYRPRCTIAEPFISVLHLSADGSQMVTVKESKTKAGQGPVKVRDTHTGQVVREMLGPVEFEQRWDRSPDGRHFAALLPDGKLRLADWRSGKEWTFDEQKDAHYFYMSSKGRWLFVYGRAPRGGVILDVTTRQVGCRLGEEDLEFSRDDRWGFARQNSQVDVWDLSTANKVATIPAESGMVTSPDGGSLITWLLDEKTDRARAERLKMRIPDRGLEIWELPTGRKRCRREFPAVGRGHAEFSPDSRFLALWAETGGPSKLELLDVANGQTLWETTATAGGEFSPNSALYFYWRGDKGRTLTMCDAATGRELWERHETGPTITRFAGALGNLLFQERGDKPLVLLDAQTGEPHPLTPRDFYMSNRLPVPTPDGKHLLMSGYQMRKRAPTFWETVLEKLWPPWFGEFLKVAIVLESATGRELFRVRDHDSRDPFLSDDGSTLITLDEFDGDQASARIRVYDVHPHRAWTWAVAASLGTWLGLWCLRRGVRWLRARKKPAAVGGEAVPVTKASQR